MDKNIGIKQIIVLSVVGYILVLLLRYTEGVLTSLLKILGMILHLNPDIFEFIEIIPQLLIIVLWIILLFNLTKGFAWEDIVDLSIIKRFGKGLGIFTICLFIALIGLRFLEAHLWTKYLENYIPDHELMKIKSMTLQSLNLIETIIIAIGFIRIIKKK
jgi:uncharacterized membrane protein